tara:strand:+ start:525 stop:1187 length:663 start_codon:yes stop_codon:yes gene_type:complete
MSLGFDTEYHKRLRQKLKEFDNPIGANRTQPEMMYRQRHGGFVLPMVSPDFPPLELALKAERGISLAQGQHEPKMEGEGLGSFVKGAVKGVKKASKSVAKGAKKVAKSKEMKAIGKVSKKVGSKVLDEAAKHSGEAGVALGTAAAVALGQPELVPVFAAVGKEAAEAAAKPARKLVKEKTGMGKPKRPPSKWMLHVAAHRKEHGGSYKDAMKGAKITYKK